MVPPLSAELESGKSLMLKQFSIVTFYQEAPFLGDRQFLSRASTVLPIQSDKIIKKIVRKMYFKNFHALFMFGASIS